MSFGVLEIGGEVEAGVVAQAILDALDVPLGLGSEEVDELVDLADVGLRLFGCGHDASSCALVGLDPLVDAFDEPLAAPFDRLLPEPP
ncbi:MAG: hypothetical protein R2710_25510 [Acidimicrobiales bacterium]